MPTKRKPGVIAIVGSRNDGSGTDVEAVVFPLTDEWESQEARERWLSDNDYLGNGCEETDSGYKYQQTSESEFKKDSLHSVPFGHPDFVDLDAERNAGNDDQPHSTGDRKRVIFRISPSLYERLREHADREDLSANQLVCRALQEYLDERSGEKQADTQGRMQELRDLKEARALLGPEKDNGLIEQLQEHIRQCIQEMTGTKQQATPPKKKWYEERTKYD